MLPLTAANESLIRQPSIDLAAGAIDKGRARRRAPVGCQTERAKKIDGCEGHIDGCEGHDDLRYSPKYQAILQALKSYKKWESQERCCFGVDQANLGRP